MQKYPDQALGQAPSSSPKWVPISKADWGFIAGAAAVVALAAAAIFLPKKK